MTSRLLMVQRCRHSFLVCTLALMAFLAACVPPTLPNSTAAGALVAGSTTLQNTGESVKIGLITPLTGTMAGYGAGQRIAAQLAVEDVNSTGGINGIPLALVLLDDAASPNEDAVLVRRLAAQDKVVAIIGPLTGAGFQAAAPLANELRLPLITAGLTGPGMNAQNQAWAFRFSLQEAAATAKALATFKKLYPDAKKMVIVGDIKEPVSNYSLGTIFPQYLKEAGMAVIDTAYFDTGTTDFSAPVAKIRSLNPQGIAFSSLAPEAVALARELQRQRLRVPVLASAQNWAGPEISLAGDAMEGWLAAGAFDEDTIDQPGKTYAERFRKAGAGDPALGKLARPGPWAPTYDAVTALAQVMRQAQVTPDTDLLKVRVAIQAGLHDLKGFRGITGEISMLPTGDISVPTLTFVAKGGKWILAGQP